MTKQRLLTGDRPTGRLHLGHYVGSLVNRVRLQHEYETFLIIADMHMLTTRNTRAEIDAVPGNAHDMVLDWLAAGIDPSVATFYLQSAIPEVCELNTLFQNLVSVPRLERIPSLKDMARAAGKEEMPYGLLGYPVLQAADILCVRANLVPVGKDNEAHVEITREIARRFNHLYGEVFPIPGLMKGDVPTLVGTDGQAKMSKSLNNTIYLGDDAAAVRKKVFGMFTDPARIRADIPGTVEGNPVFAYHAVFNPDKDEVRDLEERYRAGTVSDVEVKEKLVVAINGFLDPMRERRARYESQRGLVEELIVGGTDRTRAEVVLTLRAAKSAMGLSGVWNRIRRKAEERAKRRDDHAGRVQSPGNDDRPHASGTGGATAFATAPATASATGHAPERRAADAADESVAAYCGALGALGIAAEPLHHPAARDVSAVLQSLGLNPAHCTPALIMRADGEFIVVVIRGDTRADFKKVKALLGVRDLRMASPEEFESVVHVPVGAARVYNPGMRTILDERIFETDAVTGGSGRFDCSIRVRSADLPRLPGSVVADVSR